MGLHSFFEIYHNYPEYMYVTDNDLYLHKQYYEDSLVEWYKKRERIENEYSPRIKNPNRDIH